MKRREGAKKTRSDGPPVRRILRLAAALVTGVFVGTLLLGSASAHLPSTFNARHLGRHAWLGFVKERSLDRFFTKRQANRRFLRKSEQAADADKLDGKDSTAFQEACRQGTVHGSALIDAHLLTATYSEVTEAFSCHGVARAKKLDTGRFRVDLGHKVFTEFGSCGEQHWQVTPYREFTHVSATVQTEQETSGFPGRANCVAEVWIWGDISEALIDQPFYIALLN